MLKILRSNLLQSAMTKALLRLNDLLVNYLMNFAMRLQDQNCTKRWREKKNAKNLVRKASPANSLKTTICETTYGTCINGHLVFSSSSTKTPTIWRSKLLNLYHHCNTNVNCDVVFAFAKTNFHDNAMACSIHSSSVRFRLMSSWCPRCIFAKSALLCC